jgi:hypothetical protein
MGRPRFVTVIVPPFAADFVQQRKAFCLEFRRTDQTAIHAFIVTQPTGHLTIADHSSPRHHPGRAAMPTVKHGQTES